MAVAGLCFQAPDLVARAWNDVPDGLTHFGVAEFYARMATDWGERALADLDPARLERLDTLTRRIIGAAPHSLGSVFAGWRAMPTPDSVAGRVALTTHVFREMRGAAHIAAVIAVGLAPVDAVVASTNAPPYTGPDHAERMGFVGPFRDPQEVRRQRLDADALTNRILEPFFDVLTPSELAEFADLFQSTRNAIDI